MAECKWKRIVAIATAAISFGGNHCKAIGAETNPNGHPTEAALQAASDSAQSGWLFVPYAQFKIPFNIEPGGTAPSQVQLWVSTDNGINWQLHSSLGTEKRFFEFRAAGEGSYLFAVQTRDTSGAAYPSPQPPMRVIVDTTRPEASIHADMDATGRLIAQFEIAEQYLNADTIRLEYRTDKDTAWQSAIVDGIHRTGQALHGHAVILPTHCREVVMRLTLSDLAQNKAEATANFTMPRTASAVAGMQLASQRAEQSPTQGKAQAPVAKQQSAAKSPFGVGPAGKATAVNPNAKAANATVPTPGGTVWNAGSKASPQSAPAESPSTRSAASQTPELASLRGWTDARNNSKPIAASKRLSADQKPGSLAASHSLATGQPGNSFAIGGRSEVVGVEPVVERQAPTRQVEATELEGMDQNPAGALGNYPVRARPTPEELPAPAAVEDAQPNLVLGNGLGQAIEERPVSINRDQSSAGGQPIPAMDPAPVKSTDKAMGVPPGVMKTEPKALASGSDIGLNETSAPEASANGSPEASANGSPEASANGSLETPFSTAQVPPTSQLSQVLHSRSRAFSLDYAVDSLKGSQISDVELWGTEDGGRTWVQWGSDPDRESPFDVQVADDGLFGFRMVVVGANGLVSGRPKDGDDADAWINVDSVSPAVKITRAVYGEGPEAGMLVIDYKCEDANLHDQPVTLSFSDRQNGPWTTIASGLRNTGVYLWKASPNLPKKIYLRIEATDRGGNVAAHRLDLPIAVEGLAPRGRIQGFRPLETPPLETP